LIGGFADQIGAMLLAFRAWRLHWSCGSGKGIGQHIDGSLIAGWCDAVEAESSSS